MNKLITHPIGKSEIRNRGRLRPAMRLSSDSAERGHRLTALPRSKQKPPSRCAQSRGAHYTLHSRASGMAEKFNKMVENRRSDGEKADRRLPSLTGGLKGGSDEQDPGLTQAAMLRRLEKTHALFSSLQFCSSTRFVYNSLPRVCKEKKRSQ